MSEVLKQINEKATIWQQLKSDKIAIIASYLISKSIIGAVFMVLIDLEPFEFLEDRWSLIFPIFNLQNFLNDIIFITLLSLDTILFSFLIKNLIQEINNKAKWFLAIGFLITPIIYKTLFFLVAGRITTSGITQFQNEIYYIFSASYILLATLLALIFKVSLCYILLNRFRQKKETLSIFKIDVRLFMWLFIPAMGYVYFFLKFLIYFISNYSEHIVKLEYSNRGWWISNILMPAVSIFLFIILIQFVFLFFANLKEEKKEAANYFVIILAGIILPIVLILFENQVFQIITYILNFLINLSKYFY
jgi:hypothetical protein